MPPVLPEVVIEALTPAEVADVRTLVDFILGWWPGLEDGLSWPACAEHPTADPRFAAARRLAVRLGCFVDA